MSLSTNFNGATIVVPGAYTDTRVRQTGGLSRAETGIVGIVGEASKGAPGAVSGVVEYFASGLSSLIEQFGSGPIVDAAKALVNASNDPRITNPVGRILIYKTNNSLAASLALATGWGTLTSQNYGVEENLIAVEIEEDTNEVFELEFGADFTATPGSNLTLRVNGGTLVTLTAASCTSAANTVTELNSKLNTALSTVGIAYASAVVDRISLDLTITGTGALRKGMGITLEFIASTEWLDVGVTVPQQGVALAAGVSGAVSLTASNPTRTIVVSRQSDGIEESTDATTGEIGGDIYMEIGCNAVTSCTLTINATQMILDATGGGASDLALNLSEYNTLLDLAEYINAQAGYSCSIPADINGGLPPTVLDRVSTVGVCAGTAGLKSGKIKADSYSVQRWFDLNSQLVSVEQTTFLGFPDEVAKTFLAGGTLGSSATSSFDAGFTAFEGIRTNTIIPLVSQDASDDIAEDPTITSASSTYDIESIHVLTRDHCKKMSNTINRSERDCFVGFRGTFAEVKTQAKTVASEFVSLCFQDSEVIGTNGELQYKQPHITACVIAGMQAGAEVGEPMTHKYMSANGVKHVKKQGITPSSLELYKMANPGDQSAAIVAGLTIVEAPSSGGIRVVLHNTTYQKDQNFVFNRKHVLATAHYIAYNLRTNLEDTFVGEKAKTGTAETIRNFVIAEMDTFRNDGFIVGDISNKNLGYKNLSVTLIGSSAYIDVIITPVVGIDFILTRIELDQIRQSA